MPAILEVKDVDTWLHGPLETARLVLRQYASEPMLGYKVSSMANAAKNKTGVIASNLLKENHGRKH